MKSIRITHFLIVLIFLISSVLFSCDSLNREIELDLPEYETEMQVESYMLPGLPLYFLSLTETVGYFDPFELPVINDATVVIKYGNETDTLIPVNLTEGFVIPGLSTDTVRLFLPGVEEVYLGLRTSPDDFTEPFELTIIDEKNDRTATSRTQLKELVQHDSMTYDFDDKGMAYVLSYFTDIPGERNYYRRILKQKKPFPVEGTEDTLWLSDVEQSFIFDDELSDGEQFVLGTAFEYEEGDTLISYLYHINKEYYDYIESTDGAIQANFSPFSQPSRVLDNIIGGTGIFTGMALHVDTVIVGE